MKKKGNNINTWQKDRAEVVQLRFLAPDHSFSNAPAAQDVREAARILMSQALPESRAWPKEPFEIPDANLMIKRNKFKKMELVLLIEVFHTQGQINLANHFALNLN